ncbi:hypothetical protein [Actinobacillus equuli]|uniref:hypothetical protein n=1 Tax=Actinobacillus equuli TaxID=718 RepID=UPI0024466861|nr:hypothetical protein [Actinobacillus equuli]WGE83280.1 hypothetical protein NYR86_09700 [Actinobacillus equuli subsp. equuli]
MCFFKMRSYPHISESITKHLGNIDHSLADIAKENREEEYTKYSNLISIISTAFTLLGIFGTIFGAFILYSYLKDIEALNIFPQSISNTNLFGFAITYFLINIFIYILSILPSLIIYRNINNITTININKIAFNYSIPMLVSLAFFLIFYFLEFNVTWANNLFLGITIIIPLITLCLVWDTLKNENGKINIQKISETFFYFIFISLYSFLIITSMNKGQDDFLYYFYATIIFLSTIFSNYLTAQNIRNNKTSFRKIISDHFVLLIFSIIVIPSLVYQSSEVYNEYFNQKVKTAFSYRIMQAFGYADRNDKIYFIDQDFISREIKSNPQYLYKDTIKDTYKAYCGRIYWKTDTTTVFKKYDDESYKKIPNDKIFESQNTDFYCIGSELTKKEDLVISIINFIHSAKDLVKGTK